MERKMEEKKTSRIICEMLIGIIMTLPFFINEKNRYLHAAWITVLFKALFSVGIPLAVIKLMSIVYRFISIIFKRILYVHTFLYYLFFCMFVAGGVYEWYQYQEYMRKGYFWVEVISYIVCAIWFLIDVNTTKCIREIRGIEEWLIQALREHEDYVEKYKDKMKRINKRKDRELKVLEEFYPKKFFSDPLKNLRKEIDISRANNYQRYIPHVLGDYSGIKGLKYGASTTRLYYWNVKRFIQNMEDDRKWMKQEMEVYGGKIKNIEEQLEIIRQTGDNVAAVSSQILMINPTIVEKFQNEYEKEINIAKTNSENVKDFWKMHKKINKLRRNHYER